LLLLAAVPSSAQETDKIFKPNIHSVKLHVKGDQLSYPIMRLNSGDQLELHFDDLDADVKYYSYTFVLCNTDWIPAMLSQFDYMKGFSNVRINTYRNSSLVLTRYTHYTCNLPDRNTTPIRSGNYILKVFTNGDTSQVAFTKRFLVLDPKVSAGATIVQPFNTSLAKTQQKLQFNVNVQNIKPTNIFQQIKVVILQNYRWDNSISNLQPTFIKQNILEYNTENQALFPAQKEWRWVDLTSFRLQTDRIEKGDYTNSNQTLFIKPEGERKDLRYMYYRDYNGMYQLMNIEQNNPYWQGDYATVWFRYSTPDRKEMPGKEIYLFV
jgi:ribosomal protein L28